MTTVLLTCVTMHPQERKGSVLNCAEQNIMALSCRLTSTIIQSIQSSDIIITDIQNRSYGLSVTFYVRGQSGDTTTIDASVVIAAIRASQVLQ